MTFDLASETVVLGGAIGSARKYELFRELTSDKWNVNLSQIGNEIANLMDIEQPDMMCDAELPYVEVHLPCSDRLRLSVQLLAMTHSHLTVPIIEPLFPRALIEEDIAATCNTPSKAVLEGIAAECVIDAPRLRKKLVAVLIGLSTKIAPENDKLRKNIQQSALSVNNDRTIHVTSRGGLITGELLGSFGAFLDYKFREFDYYTGVYDAIVGVSSDQCRRNFPARKHGDEVRACRNRLSEQMYDLVGVNGDAKGKYLFALMAKPGPWPLEQQLTNIRNSLFLHPRHLKHGFGATSSPTNLPLTLPRVIFRFSGNPPGISSIPMPAFDWGWDLQAACLLPAPACGMSSIISKTRYFSQWVLPTYRVLFTG
jgi:hypothetical protein